MIDRAYLPRIAKITENKMDLVQKVEPNFIYNRFDSMYENDFELYEISEVNTRRYIPLHINKRIAAIGVWLAPISAQAFRLLIETIFFEYPGIDAIQARYSLNYYKGLSISNHWRIDLPNTVEEFDNSLSRKTRSNMRRHFKNLMEDMDNCVIQKYAVSEISDEIVEKYFYFKKQTHDINYGMTPQQYVTAFFVTHCYTLTINDAVQSILFVCDLDNIVYLENLAFNPELSKYSIGTVLYYYMIKDLITLGKKSLYIRRWRAGIQAQVLRRKSGCL